MNVCTSQWIIHFDGHSLRPTCRMRSLHGPAELPNCLLSCVCPAKQSEYSTAASSTGQLHLNQLLAIPARLSSGLHRLRQHLLLPFEGPSHAFMNLCDRLGKSHRVPLQHSQANTVYWACGFRLPAMSSDKHATLEHVQAAAAPAASTAQRTTAVWLLADSK